MKKNKLKTLLLLTASVCVFGSVTASAVTPKNVSFYKDKTLTIVVPYGPGGGFDRWARLVGEYIKKPLGVAEVKIVNRPGGGGLIGANAIYNSKPDGLTVGNIPAPGIVFAQFENSPGVEYDVSKFDWLGRPGHDPLALFVHSSGRYQSMNELLKRKRSIKVLASGKAATEYFAQTIFFNILNIPHRMVAAFSGSHQMRATFLSGGGDVFAITSHHAPQMAPDVKPVAVFSSERFDKLPEIQTVVELAKDNDVSGNDRATLDALVNILELGRPFVAPPGVPDSRMEALQFAFRQAIQNEELVKKAVKGDLYMGYANADQEKDKVRNALKWKSRLLQVARH